MKKTADIMGMPVTVVIVDSVAKEEDIESIFAYLREIDRRFSPYKKTSELSKINRGEETKKNYSEEMKQILLLAEQTKQDTDGFFDITKPDSTIDPSGLVKGYAIHQAAEMLRGKGYKNFYVEIAGDIEAVGLNDQHKPWRVGIENPFNRKEIIKIVGLSDKGIATSGTYVRGLHIYNPHTKHHADDIASVTVIADNIYEADRFATAVFAMGEKGIEFLERQKGLEGYMVLKNKMGVMTSGFEEFTKDV